MNNLDELVVDKKMAEEEIECSICLDKFKEGEKCIKLPCKDHPHFFHCESNDCSGIGPWFEINNTCPLCRTEFPIESPITDSENQGFEPIFPQSLIPSVVNTLNPEQVSGLGNNDLPDTTDNNIINIEEHIMDVVDHYLRRISSDIIQNTLNTTEPEDSDSDLQRAIELSLQENTNEE